MSFQRPSNTDRSRIRRAPPSLVPRRNMFTSLILLLAHLVSSIRTWLDRLRDQVANCEEENRRSRCQSTCPPGPSKSRVREKRRERRTYKGCMTPTRHALCDPKETTRPTGSDLQDFFSLLKMQVLYILATLIAAPMA
jgi:hypothetical protein